MSLGTAALLALLRCLLKTSTTPSLPFALGGHEGISV